MRCCFMIGSMDDFSSVQEMRKEWSKRGASSVKNVSCYVWDIPDDTPVDLIPLLGRGFAFSGGWCEDGSLSDWSYELSSQKPKEEIQKNWIVEMIYAARDFQDDPKKILYGPFSSREEAHGWVASQPDDEDLIKAEVLYMNPSDPFSLRNAKISLQS